MIATPTIRAGSISPDDARPLVFNYESWHLVPHQRLCVVPEVLKTMRDINGGYCPEDLKADDRLYHAFAGALAITIADADVEPALIFPNRRFASREWCNTLYLQIMEYAYLNGWLDVEMAGPTEPPSTPEPNPDEPLTEDFGDDVEVEEDRLASAAA